MLCPHLGFSLEALLPNQVPRLRSSFSTNQVVLEPQGPLKPAHFLLCSFALFVLSFICTLKGDHWRSLGSMSKSVAYYVNVCRVCCVMGVRAPALGLYCQNLEKAGARSGATNIDSGAKVTSVPPDFPDTLDVCSRRVPSHTTVQPWKRERH